VALSLLPAVLLSGQTAGGNIGNTLAPAPIAVGTASAGAVGQEGAVLRRNLVGALVLTAAVLVTLVVQYWLQRATAA
jgi:lactate permease